MIKLPPDYAELEIVGFEGSARTACGYSLPVVRYKGTQEFFKLSIRNQAHKSIAPVLASEIESFQRRGDITLLAHPIPAFENAMAIYVKRVLLDAASVTLPDAFAWQSLAEDLWVAFATEFEVVQIINRWGRILTNHSTALLREFLFTEENEELRNKAERLARLALMAASDSSLRAQIYLRYGTAVKLSNTPERLDNVYEFIIQREFPEWDWESFQKRLVRFLDLLRIKEEAEPKTGKNFNGDKYFFDPLSFVRELPLAITPQAIFELASSIPAINDPEDRIAACQTVAQRFRNQHPVDEQKIRAIADMISAYDSLSVDDQLLMVLAGEPVLYWQDVLQTKKEITPPQLNMRNLLNAATEFKKRGVAPGQVTERLFKISKKQRHVKVKGQPE
jgi:hypothetical protein